MLFPPALTGTLRKTLHWNRGAGGGRSDRLSGSARDRTTPRGWRHPPQETAFIHSTALPLKEPCRVSRRCPEDGHIAAPPGLGRRCTRGGPETGDPPHHPQLFPTHGFIHEGLADSKHPLGPGGSLKTHPELKGANHPISAGLFRGRVNCRKFSGNVLLSSGSAAPPPAVPSSSSESLSLLLSPPPRLSSQPPAPLSPSQPPGYKGRVWAQRPGHRGLPQLQMGVRLAVLDSSTEILSVLEGVPAWGAGPNTELGEECWNKCPPSGQPCSEL